MNDIELHWNENARLEIQDSDGIFIELKQILSNKELTKNSSNIKSTKSSNEKDSEDFHEEKEAYEEINESGNDCSVEEAKRKQIPVDKTFKTPRNCSEIRIHIERKIPIQVTNMPDVDC